MKIFEKINISKTPTEDSSIIDGYYLSKKEMFTKEDTIELVESLKGLTFLNRRDITWRREHLNHIMNHDEYKIHKMMYAMSQLKTKSGQSVFKIIDDYGFAGLRLVGNFNDILDHSEELKTSAESETKIETPVAGTNADLIENQDEKKENTPETNKEDNKKEVLDQIPAADIQDEIKKEENTDVVGENKEGAEETSVTKENTEAAADISESKENIEETKEVVSETKPVDEKPKPVAKKPKTPKK